MKPVISIIHGARYPCEKLGYFPNWPGQLAVFLREQGFDVEIYYWDGSIFHGLKRAQVEAYAASLREISKKYDGRKISILGKSMGASIAELALHNLNSANENPMVIDTLLRIACPDIRKVSVPNVNHVIDLRSFGDYLFFALAGLLSLAVALQVRLSLRQHTYRSVWIQQLSHSQLNDNLIVPGLKNRSLYEIYSELLAGNQSVAQIKL